jgi:hypothetical protein
LETNVGAPSEVPEQSAIALQMNQLSDDLSGLQTSMWHLEEAILDNPCNRRQSLYCVVT